MEPTFSKSLLGEIKAIGLTIGLTGADADDLVQNVCLQVVSKISMLRNEGAYRFWVLAIARRMAIDFVVDEKRRRETLVFNSDLVNYNERAKVQIDLSDSLAQVPPHYNKLLQQFYWDGMTIRELAAEYKVPLGTIKRRLHTARRLLRKVLDDEQE